MTNDAWRSPARPASGSGVKRRDPRTVRDGGLRVPTSCTTVEGVRFWTGTSAGSKAEDCLNDLCQDDCVKRSMRGLATITAALVLVTACDGGSEGDDAAPPSAQAPSLAPPSRGPMDGDPPDGVTCLVRPQLYSACDNGWILIPGAATRSPASQLAVLMGHE